MATTNRLNTRLYPTLERAFHKFVDMIRDDPEVVYVFAECPPPHIFTYIRTWDLPSGDLDELIPIYKAQGAIQVGFEDLGLEFHVRAVEGKSAEELDIPTEGLIYSRSSDGK